MKFILAMSPWYDNNYLPWGSCRLAKGLHETFKRIALFCVISLVTLTFAAAQDDNSSLSIRTGYTLNYPILGDKKEEFVPGSEQFTKIGGGPFIGITGDVRVAGHMGLEGNIDLLSQTFFYQLDGLNFGFPNNNRVLTTSFDVVIVQASFGVNHALSKRANIRAGLGLHFFFNIDDTSEVNTKPDKLTLSEFSTSELQKRNLFIYLGIDQKLINLNERMSLGVSPTVGYRFVRGEALTTRANIDLLEIGILLNIAFE